MLSTSSLWPWKIRTSRPLAHSHRRVMISGFARSGKTLLAVEKAVRLSQQGFRTLLVCSNRRLAEGLRERLVAARVPLWDKLDVNHFHNLCLRLAYNFSLPIPKVSSDADFYTRQLPTVLPQSARTNRAHYDAIIVDEAQDFDPSWWQPLQTLLRDREHGIWYLFFDDNQRLYDRPLTGPLGTYWDQTHYFSCSLLPVSHYIFAVP